AGRIKIEVGASARRALQNDMANAAEGRAMKLGVAGNGEGRVGDDRAVDKLEIDVVVGIAEFGTTHGQGARAGIIVEDDRGGRINLRAFRLKGAVEGHTPGVAVRKFSVEI